MIFYFFLNYYKMIYSGILYCLLLPSVNIGKKIIDICKYHNQETLSKPDKIKTNYNDYINSFRKNNKNP